MTTWRRCSNCKGEILVGAKYWVCSVSSCQRQRASLQYCRVTCFDVHNEIENHRDAWAEERMAPMQPDEEDAAKNAAVPRAVSMPPQPATPSAPRHVVRDAPTSSSSSLSSSAALHGGAPEEILIVVSRLKAYIKARSGGFNTSDDIMEMLSDHVRKVCDTAIENASRAGRKTVLQRDVPKA